MDRYVLATFARARNFLLDGSREWRHISAISFVHALEERATLPADVVLGGHSLLCPLVRV